MIELFRNQSRSAAGAILYVTIGTLMMIWAGLWYYYFIVPEANPPTWQKFACVGTILSGFAIGTIGLLFGLIGRGAKAADATVGVAAEASMTPVIPPEPAGIDTGGLVSSPLVTGAPVIAPPVSPKRSLPSIS